MAQLVHARKPVPPRKRVEFGGSIVVGAFAVLEFANGVWQVALALAAIAVLLIPIAFVIAGRAVRRHPDWIEVRPDRITALRASGTSWELVRNDDSTLRLADSRGQPHLHLDGLTSTGVIPLARFDLEELHQATTTEGWPWSTPPTNPRLPEGPTDITIKRGGSADMPAGRGLEVAPRPAGASGSAEPPTGPRASTPPLSNHPAAPPARSGHPAGLPPLSGYSVGVPGRSSEPVERGTRVLLRDGARGPLPWAGRRFSPKLTVGLVVVVGMGVMALAFASASPTVIVIAVLGPSLGLAVTLVVLAIRHALRVTLSVTIAPDRVSVTHGTLASQVVQRTAVTSVKVGRRYARLRGPDGKALLYVPLNPQRTAVLNALSANGWPV